MAKEKALGLKFFVILILGESRIDKNGKLKKSGSVASQLFFKAVEKTTCMLVSTS
jgi:hypothetical protein